MKTVTIPIYRLVYASQGYLSVYPPYQVEKFDGNGYRPFSGFKSEEEAVKFMEREDERI